MDPPIVQQQQHLGIKASQDYYFVRTSESAAALFTYLMKPQGPIILPFRAFFSNFNTLYNLTSGRDVITKDSKHNAISKRIQDWFFQQSPNGITVTRAQEGLRLFYEWRHTLEFTGVITP